MRYREEFLTLRLSNCPHILTAGAYEAYYTDYGGINAERPLTSLDLAQIDFDYYSTPNGV